MQPPPPPIRVSVWRALSRALHGTCPACGLAPVFRHRFRSERRCDACGWWFERGAGHWIGGSEINMIATYWAACITFISASAFFGFSWVLLVLAGAFTIAFSLAIHRPSRCLFIACDYLVDPLYDPTDGDDEGPEDPPPGPGVPPLRTTIPDDDTRAPNPSR